MNSTVKKSLVVFIVITICISLLFSMKSLSVFAVSKTNEVVLNKGECKWIGINKGLEGGKILSFVIDPENTQIIYAGTIFGVFKSTNGGESWKQSGLVNGGIVTSLAIDPENTQIIYAGIRGIGIFKSTNGGESWKQINNGLTDKRIYAVVIDPENTQIIYTGTRSGGIFKSTNGGESWENIGLASKWGESLAIDPVNTYIVYAGTLNGISKSTNVEGNWKEINNGLTDKRICSIAIDPNNTQIVYAGAWNGSVFKSTNGGESWENIGLASKNRVSSITVDPNNPQIIYAGTYGSGVFKSTNGGESWENIGLAGTWEESIVLDLKNAQTIYAITNGGIFKSINGGTSWKAINNGLSNKRVSYLAISKTDTKIIYTITSNGVFKSINGGKSWEQSGLTGGDVSSIAIDPKNPQIVYAGTHTTGVLKSTNGGTSWEEMNNGLTDKKVYSIAIDPDNTQIVYVGTWNSGIFKSTNGGESWENVGLAGKWGESLAIDPNNSQIVYAVTNVKGIFKSTNGGTSWEAMNNGLTSKYAITIAVDPKNMQIVYAGTSNGVFKSINGGKSWEQSGLTGGDVSSITIDPKNPQIVYAEIWGDGVFKSTNGGTSWEAMNNGLTDKLVNTLVVNPSNTQIIYAGTTNGIFEYVCSPSAPQNLRADAAASSIILNWNASAQGTYPIAGYEIYRSIESNKEDSSKPIATVDSDTTIYTDKDVAYGTTYYYYVKAFDNQKPKNYSGFSNEISITAPKATEQKTIITLKPDNPMMTVNHVQHEIDPGRGTKPVIIPKWSRTVVPIRAIVEALGGTIGWNGKERKVTINFNDTAIDLWIDNPKAKVNGETKWIDQNNHDVKPIIVNDRTMLPLRFVAESLGCKVDWDGTTRTITITYEEP